MKYVAEIFWLLIGLVNFIMAVMIVSDFHSPSQMNVNFTAYIAMALVALLYVDSSRAKRIAAEKDEDHK